MTIFFKTIRKRSLIGTALALVAGNLALAQTPASAPTILVQDAADILFAVLAADRAVYTKHVINRLTVDDQVIAASEQFEDEKALPLPAQMFRMGSEKTAETTDKVRYSLLSLWPINKQNAPRTALETKGLEFVLANKGKNFYGEEELGGKKYFTAVYPDVASVTACYACHNEHKQSPRKDFKLNDVMGGVVIRIPVAAKP